MHLSLRHFRKKCVQFAEKQGFPVIVTVCVAVITATALWSGKQEPAYVSPTPPVSSDISAAQLVQQSLRDAASPTPCPTEAPLLWQPPLKDFSVLHPFSPDALVQSGVTGVWRLHAGVDLAAKRGEPVYAMGRGLILEHGMDALLGVWFRVDHDGVETLYAGMVAAGDFLSGDMVQAGDTLGFVGSGPLEERDQPPHLHLETRRDGIPFDPQELWRKS